MVTDALLGDHFGTGGGIGVDNRLQPQFADDFAALRQSMNMGMNMGQLFNFCARQCQQMMIDALEMFADNKQIGIRQQVMNIGDPAGHRIIDGNHGKLGPTVKNGGKGIFKSMAWQGFHLRVDGPAGKVRIGPGSALEGDSFVCVRHLLLSLY